MPKKKANKRQLTPAQRKAGFGGKRAMTNARGGAKKKTTTRAKPKTRTTAKRKPARATVVAKRKTTPRRKTGMLGGLPGVDLMSVGYAAGGIIGVKVLPGLVSKVLPGVPRAGLTGYGVKIVGAIAIGYGVKALTKSQARANQVMAGALGMVAYELFSEYVAPKIGLSGLSGLGDTDGYVTNAEIDGVLYGGDVAGYIPAPAPTAAVTNIGTYNTAVAEMEMAG